MDKEVISKGVINKEEPVKLFDYSQLFQKIISSDKETVGFFSKIIKLLDFPYLMGKLTP